MTTIKEQLEVKLAIVKGSKMDVTDNYIKTASIEELTTKLTELQIADKFIRDNCEKHELTGEDATAFGTRIAATFEPT